MSNLPEPDSLSSVADSAQTPPPTFVTAADQKGIERRAELKRKLRSFFITENDNIGMKIHEDSLRPKTVDLRPRSPAQIILFELPLLIHLPFFFLIQLTQVQFIQLLQSALITFALSLVCIHLMNRASTTSKRAGIIIFIVLFIIVNIYLLSQVFIMTGDWFYTSFPVFERLFN
jgi:hypothetical protein